MEVINWIIDTPFAIAGIAYFILVLWLFWEAYNTPLTPDEYDEKIKQQKD